MLRYLLDQLQAYQQQLREMQLQNQWRHTASRDPLPPLALNSSAAAGGGAAHDSSAPGLGTFGGAGGLFQDRDAGGSMGMQHAVFPSGVDSPGSADRLAPADEAGSAIAVDGPVRPWGKRAKDLPLTRHTPSTFQKGHVSRLPSRV